MGWKLLVWMGLALVLGMPSIVSANPCGDNACSARGYKVILGDGTLAQEQEHTGSGRLTLVPVDARQRSKLDTPQAVVLQASLICQRKVGSRYEDVADCTPKREKDRVTLKAGDRVKLRFEPEQDGFVYLMVYNDQGQVQMAIPNAAMGVPDHRVKASQQYVFPLATRDWFVLDTISGTTDHLRLYFSPYMIRELENARGIDAPPSGSLETSVARLPPDEKPAGLTLLSAANRGVRMGGRTAMLVQIGAAEYATTNIEHSGEDAIVTTFSFHR